MTNVNVYRGETFRIWYRAKGGTTGLTDVKITILAPDASLLVDNQTLTEAGNGWYYYDCTDTDTLGDYAFSINSDSTPGLEKGMFRVIPALRQPVSGTGFILPDWLPEEKEKAVSLLEEIVKQIKKLKSKNMSKNEKIDKSLSKIFAELKKIRLVLCNMKESDDLRDKVLLSKIDSESLAQAIEDESF